MIDEGVHKLERSALPALLVVDDDPIISATLASGLRSIGYDVWGVNCPLQALELCKTHRFDLALVDQQMPSMSGVELVRRIRESHDLHSIFVSAYGGAELVDEAAAAGVLSYFVKPVDPISLSPAIRAALVRVQDVRAARNREHTLRDAIAGERNINTAVGVLMEHLKLNRSEAFECLRQFARSQRVPAVSVANDLVSAVNDAHNLLNAIARHRKSGQGVERQRSARSSDE